MGNTNNQVKCLCIAYPTHTPTQFARGLAAAIVKHGGRIYERTRVVNYHYTNARVVTDDKHHVDAQHVVLATNVPINRDLTFHTGRITARKKYIAALTIPRGTLPPGLYYTTEPTYHSMRIVPGGQQHGGVGTTDTPPATTTGGPSSSPIIQNTPPASTTAPPPEHDVLLVVGEHHASGQFERHYREYVAAVEGWVRGRVGNVGQLVAGWSVQCIEPVDKLGLYGASVLASKRNVWVATGDSGQAVTGGALAAMIIGALVGGGGGGKRGDGHRTHPLQTPSYIVSCTHKHAHTAIYTLPYTHTHYHIHTTTPTGGGILGPLPPFASTYAPSRVPPVLHSQVASHWVQEAVNVGVNYGEAVLPKVVWWWW